MEPPSTDRRALLRQRHREAILEAAAELLNEAGGTRFTVDQLAARADISRRTVFNHFASLDDVVVAVCAAVLDTVVDTFLAIADTSSVGAGESPDDAPGAASAASLFDQLTRTLRSSDLVPPMAYLSRALGGSTGEWTPQQATIVGRAFTDVSARLSGAMVARHPHVAPIDIHILVGSLMSGVMVLNRVWFEATGAAEDDHSRAVWSELVDRLVVTFRTGYGTPAEPATGPPALT